jgi:hypothetical protein
MFQMLSPNHMIIEQIECLINLCNNELSVIDFCKQITGYCIASVNCLVIVKKSKDESIIALKDLQQ